MKKNKLQLVLCCLLLITAFSLPADAKPRKKCLNARDFDAFLANNYNVKVIFANRTLDYKLKLNTRPNSAGLFDYDVSFIDASGQESTLARSLQGEISFGITTLAFPGTDPTLGVSTLLPQGVLSCFVNFSPDGKLAGFCNQILPIDPTATGSLVATTSIPQIVLIPALN